MCEHAATEQAKDTMLREPPTDNAGEEAGGDAGPSVAEVLRATLAPLAAGIDAAFIYGSMARGAGTEHGDIDVMIIGSGIAYADVIPHLIKAAKYIGRTINPSVYSAAELTGKLASGNRLVRAVLKQHKIFLIGSDDDIPQPR